MTYAIIGAGLAGTTLARFFAAKDISVLMANSRGPETLAEPAAEIGPGVSPTTAAEAVKADVILVAVGALAFKDVAALLHDWSGKIIIDVTNGFVLPPEVQQAEYQGRLTSEVNAERVPGAKLVKEFNQLPFKVLAGLLPDDVGRRVVFVSSDHEDASATVANSRGNPWLCSDRSRQDRRRRAPHPGTGTPRFPKTDQIPAVGLATASRGVTARAVRQG